MYRFESYRQIHPLRLVSVFVYGWRWQQHSAVIKWRKEDKWSGKEKQLACPMFRWGVK